MLTKMDDSYRYIFNFGSELNRQIDFFKNDATRDITEVIDMFSRKEIAKLFRRLNFSRTREHRKDQNIKSRAN